MVGYFSQAQSMGIGTNTPDTSARLEIKSDKKGILLPRISNVQVISSPVKGLLAYDSTLNDLMINKGNETIPSWTSLSNESSSWSLTGNAGTNPLVNFLGTTGDDRLVFKIRGRFGGTIDSLKNNTAFGFKADQHQPIGGNTAFGFYSLSSNVEGNNNTAFGTEALWYNTHGDRNIAIGSAALWVNTYGIRNVAIGWGAINQNELGGNNTGIGNYALGAAQYENYVTAVGSTAMEYGDGLYNTVFASKAMRYSDNAPYNTSFGSSSMENIYTASFGLAVGAYALHKIYTGVQNTAIGINALYNTEFGQSNVGMGWNALANNANKLFNTAIGDGAAFSSVLGESNTVVGSGAYYTTTGSENNTMFGYHAGFNKNLGWNNTLIGADANLRYDDLFNSIVVGMGAETGLSNMGMFGNTYTNSIGGPRGWSNLSDGRFKKDIKENVKGLEFIKKLRPVTYHLNVTALQNFQNPEHLKKADEKILQSIAAREKEIETGFIAQEVDQAAKDAGYEFNGVVRPANDGDHYKMKYESFVVPLVKGMQEQQQQIEELSKTDALQLKKLEDIKIRLSKLEDGK